MKGIRKPKWYCEGKKRRLGRPIRLTELEKLFFVYFSTNNLDKFAQRYYNNTLFKPMEPEDNTTTRSLPDEAYGV